MSVLRWILLFCTVYIVCGAAVIAWLWWKASHAPIREDFR